MEKSTFSIEQVSVLDSNDKDSGIVANIRGTPESLFRNGYLTIECVAKFDDVLFDKKEITVDRSEPEGYRANLAAPTASRRQSWGEEDNEDGHYRYVVEN